MADQVRFIRKGGRIIPIRAKKKTPGAVQIAAAGVGGVALGVSAQGAFSSATNHSRAMTEAKKAVVAHSFGLPFQYDSFKQSARFFAKKSVAAKSRSLKGAAVYVGAVATMALMGYLNRPKKKGK